MKYNINNVITKSKYINNYLKNDINSTSLIMINLNNITKQYLKWINFLPNIKPYYAIKANPDDIIIKKLYDLGCNFDCASVNEIKLVKKIINDNNYNKKIIFANPIKNPVELINSKKLNVNLITLDCIEELNKVNNYNKNAEIIIRIAVDDSNSICKFNKKFGCNINDAEKIIKLAKYNKQKIIGVSFHVGSGCSSYDSYSKAIKDAKKIFTIGLFNDYKLRLLDIGGGFLPIDTHIIKFKELSNVINDTIKNEFKDVTNLEVIAEPGRFMIGTCTTMYSTIGGKKIKDDNHIYYIDNGVYGVLSCKMFDYNTPNFTYFKKNKNKNNENKIYNSTIFGPTCDSLDVIVENIPLINLNIGDKLIFKNIGAYTTASATTFNGLNHYKKYYFDKY